MRLLVMMSLFFVGALGVACGDATGSQADMGDGVDVGGGGDNGTQGDAGNQADDMGTSMDDMGTSMDDMGTSMDDMGTSMDDMGTSADDMGTPTPCRVGVGACGRARYCAVEEGTCAAEGECLIRPLSCPDVLSPVCGCDGTTYDNECFAASSGANVDFHGTCPVQCEMTPRTGCCFDDGDCRDGTRCVGESCSDSGEGTCVDTNLARGECWEDTDCGAGEACRSATRCGCGLFCLVPDAPGVCEGRQP